MTEDFATAPFPAEPQAQWLLALKGRVRRQAGLLALAEHMLGTAGDDDWALGRALAVRTWALLGQRRLQDAAAAAEQACLQLARCSEPAAGSLAADLRSQLALNDNDPASVVRHALPATELPESARLPQEWSILFGRLAASHERLGLPEEALRWHYRALPLAASCGDPMVHAHVLSGVGGLQLSLFNVEDAAEMCEQAWQLVRHEPPGTAWVMSATNWAMVLMLQRRYEQAVPLADAILAQDSAMAGFNRYQYLLLLGELLAHAGQHDRAQQLLDKGLALHPRAAERPVNWARAQVTLWNAQGRHLQALTLCESSLDAIARRTGNQNHEDFDLMRLHEEACRAYEALGQLEQALAAYRESVAVSRRMSSEALRARRLTLQVQSEVDLARRERDHALQRERQAAQEKLQLNALNRQLEESSRAKSRFLAAASHDLRQPLHALGLQLAHLRSGVDGAARDAVEQRMERTLGSLTHMFDTLLDLSRMDAGVMTPRLQAVALTPMLVRLVDEFTPLAQARGLRLSLHLCGDSSTRSDPALLETMLRNLLANALKYTLRGGVLLALRRRSKNLVLEVWDTGVGIAAHECERIFEEFYQIDDAVAAVAQRASTPAHQDRDRVQGLGLGLSIVKRLSVLLQHPLQLHSQPGRGTRFRLCLPAVHGAEVGAASAAAALPEAGATQRLHVAVIEDDVEVRDSLAALLRRWGHEVLEGGNAADVLAALQAPRRRPDGPAAAALDAVIADFGLAAGAQGDTEVARLRRAVGREVPALVVSGDTSPAHLRALQSCGLPWLTKPLQPARLRAWLATCSRAGADDQVAGPGTSTSAAPAAQAVGQAAR